MKRILLISCVLFASFSFAQVIDVFNYNGALNANGWTTHNGTGGQLVTTTTPSDNGNSLSYAGLPPSSGNRVTTVAGNNEDVNHALSGISGVGYFSFILKVPNTTGINAAGDYFIGFGGTAGATVSNLASRVFVKPGVTPGTFMLGIQNTTGGTPTQSYEPTEYAVGTSVFVVVKYDRTVTNHMASLFINPVPGQPEPVADTTNNSGTATTFVNFASLYIRQNGSAASGTGNLEIDEIRAGSTWNAVTCNTSSTLNVTNCGPYTLNSQTYTTSGTYQQVIPNAAGCDSTITLNLVVNNPTSSTINASSCSSYTLNSQTYTSSGTYVQTLPNANSVGCDSTITLNLTIVASITYYEDFDNDGYGNPAVTQSGCSQPVGYVANDDDCDDNNNAIGMGQTYYADTDNDGFGDAAVDSVACTQPAGYVTDNTDCDDNNGAIGAPFNYYPDLDNDGHGSAAATPVAACTPPANHVLNNDDCNDANPNVYPGATEIPNNGVDEDCSGSDFNTIGAQIGLYEFTGNDCTTPMLSVTTQPANATFSDYSSDSVNCAAATNVYNNSGWNMGTTIDLTEFNEFTITPDPCYELELTRLTLGHRISNSADTLYVHLRSSLDNYSNTIWTKYFTAEGVLQNDTILLPGAFAAIQGPVTFRFYVTEINSNLATYRQDNVGVNGFIHAMMQQTYYADADGDGFGDPAVDSMDCTAPQGYVSDNTDCNDNNAAENPNAVWYLDADTDGFGDATVDSVSCTQPAGYVSNDTDCDDSNSGIGSSITYYLDADNDGYGDANNTTVACTQPVGYVTISGDCDDNDDQVTVPANVYYADTDNDGFGDSNNSTLACSLPNGYVDNSDDCDDTDQNITTGNTYYEDADSDGFGNGNSVMVDCTQPAGYVTDNTDCDDTNDQIYPGATDIADNTIDENCDGVDGYLGLNELSEMSAQVFPNPGTDNVNIELSGNWNPNVTVTILAADGKVVAAQIMKGNKVAVATENLQTGIYLIRVTDGTNNRVMRWVKH